MIRAIVFDCYGVLVTDGWLPFRNEQFSHSSEAMDQARYLNKQTNIGMLSYDDFIQKIAELASMPSAQVIRAIESNVPNKPLFKYLKELKKAYKIGMLSNVAEDLIEELFSKEELGCFDALALSHEMGFVKPDLRAYQEVARRLGVETSECVIVDDLERNCTAAQEAGMKAVWYRDFDQMKKDLEKILADAKT